MQINANISTADSPQITLMLRHVAEFHYLRQFDYDRQVLNIHMTEHQIIDQE